MATTDYDNLPGEETRAIVTPFAFKVAPELLGKPLAKPGRRGLAMLIDLCLISLLTFLITSLLVIVVAFLMWRLSRPQAGTFMLWPFQLFLRFIAILLIIGAVASWAMRDDISGQIASYKAAYKVIQGESRADIEAAESTNIFRVLSDALNLLGLGFGWSGVYFTFFIARWSGQTPGKRFMKIKVVKLNNEPITLWNSFERYGGYGAGLATGLLGFLQIYWDPNRQAMHDRISSTVVLDLKSERKAAS